MASLTKSKGGVFCAVVGMETAHEPLRAILAQEVIDFAFQSLERLVSLLQYREEMDGCEYHYLLYIPLQSLLTDISRAGARRSSYKGGRDVPQGLQHHCVAGVPHHRDDVCRSYYPYLLDPR